MYFFGGKKINKHAYGTSVVWKNFQEASLQQAETTCNCSSRTTTNLVLISRVNLIAEQEKFEEVRKRGEEIIE